MSFQVLLVDDEEELVSSMAERLAFRDIRARYVTTGREALRLAGEEPFDVAVLDVKMPGLSGLALMRLLKKTRPGMRFIFLTGHGSEEDYRACCESGAASYLVKPVSIEALVQHLKEASK